MLVSTSSSLSQCCLLEIAETQEHTFRMGIYPLCSILTDKDILLQRFWFFKWLLLVGMIVGFFFIPVDGDLAFSKGNFFVAVLFKNMSWHNDVV